MKNVYKESVVSFVIILCIFLPLFISLDFSAGINFDAWVYHKYQRPSVPLSAVFLVILFLLNIRNVLLDIDNNVWVLVGILMLYMIINVYFGINRAVVIGIGMLVPILSYYVFKQLFSNKRVLDILYYSLAFFIILKLFTDTFLFFGIIFGDIVVTPADNNYAYPNFTVESIISLLDSSKLPFSTMFFLDPSIVVYIYYTYFSFVYYLMITLAVHFVLRKKHVLLSMLLIMVSFVVMREMMSRVFIYGVLLCIPIVIYFVMLEFRLRYKLPVVKTSTFFNVLLFFVFVVTVIIGNVELNKINIDHSLLARYEMWYRYFDVFEFKHLIFPFLNSNRYVSGDLHNQFLEMFSYFGVSVMLYFHIIRGFFVSIIPNYKVISFMLIFILLISMLIQSNLTHLYLGVIIGAVLAVLNTDSSDDAKAVLRNE